MPKTITVKLPTGGTESRVSDRPYTHAVLVEYNVSHATYVAAKHANEIASLEYKLIDLTAEAATPEGKAAYDIAVATEAKTCAAKGDLSNRAGWAAWSNAHRALYATAKLAASEAARQLNHRRNAVNVAQSKIGTSFVFGWSQSAKNAEKMASKAREVYPGAQITVSTEIAIRVPTKRTKKS